MTDAKRYADPADRLNGEEYHSGKPCIENGCDNPAGTAWSPLWCQPCNVKRMERIGAALKAVELTFADINPSNVGRINKSSTSGGLIDD